MIRVESITKSFKAVQALRGVSFTAADGHITGLLGPNGAGKSTALRILCTVLQADSGQAWIDDIEVSLHESIADRYPNPQVDQTRRLPSIQGLFR